MSFYNETLGKPIYPTPVLGVLGLLEDAEYALGSGFQNEGDVILLLEGKGKDAGLRPETARAQEFASSEYAKTIHGIVAGAPPAIDLDAEKQLIECLVKLASEKIVLSAHDVSDGGLAVTLAESCFDRTGTISSGRDSFRVCERACRIRAFWRTGRPRRCVTESRFPC